MIEQILQTEIDTWAKLKHPAHLQIFVQKNGRKFESAKNAKKFGKPKLCFMNAYHYASKHSLEYVEGFVMIPNIPFLIHHAWCCEMGDNTPIETTIKDNTGYEYYGIEFDLYTVEKQLMKNKVYGILDTGYGLNIDLMKDMGYEFEIASRRS